MSKNPEIGSNFGSGKPKNVLDNDVQELSKNVQESDPLKPLVDRLNAGWEWLDAHPDHPEFEARTDRWIAWLREYERAFDALCRDDR